MSKVLFSGSCSQNSGSQGRKFQGCRFRVLGVRVPCPRVLGVGVSCPRVTGSQVPEFRIPGGPRVPSPGSQGPGSQVLILDYALKISVFTRKHQRWSLLIKLQTWRPAKRLQHRCFPANIAKFLRTPFLQNTSCDCFCKMMKFYEDICWFFF